VAQAVFHGGAWARVDLLRAPNCICAGLLPAHQSLAVPVTMSGGCPCLAACAEGSEGGGFEGLGGEGGEDGEGGWEMEDLEIPAEVAAEAASAAEISSVFVAPTPGASASNLWQTKCSLVAEQVAAGAFDTAMRLLTRCVALGAFLRACFWVLVAAQGMPLRASRWWWWQRGQAAGWVCTPMELLCRQDQCGFCLQPRHVFGSHFGKHLSQIAANWLAGRQTAPPKEELPTSRPSTTRAPIVHYNYIQSQFLLVPSAGSWASSTLSRSSRTSWSCTRAPTPRCPCCPACPPPASASTATGAARSSGRTQRRPRW
jgi:hypothetical protein